MLLDKDVAITSGTTGIGNVEIPVPASMNGLTVTEVGFVISPLGTYGTSGPIQFIATRHRTGTTGTMATNMSISSAATSGTYGIDSAFSTLATNDYLTFICTSSGTAAVGTTGKGPLWAKIVAE